MNNAETKKHRRLPKLLRQYSLRAFGIALFIAAIPLALWVNKAHRQKQAVREVHALAGVVYYDFEINYANGAGNQQTNSFDVYKPTSIVNKANGAGNQKTSAIKAWLEPLLGVDYFHRVTVVNLSMPNFRHSSLPYKRRAVLNPPSHQGKVRLLSQFNDLEELYLAGNALADEDLRQIKHMSSLRKLNLDYTEIGDAAMRNISCLKNLEELLLLDARVTDTGIRHLSNL